MRVRWWLQVSGLALVIVFIGVAGTFNYLWRQSDTVDSIGWPETAAVTEPVDAVTATWLGISTILFDDGETQILIDGVFTRVNPVRVLTFRPVRSDVATINYALARFSMTRLRSIVPVHSHFDHAMDVGHVANRSSALVIGSESTANVARGADVPVDQYQILADGEERQFGDFRVRLVESRHAPIGMGDQEIFPGIIGEPLRQPARVSAYRTGVPWSVFVSHPRGTTLVQGSAGFIDGKLEGESADVVMLCVAGLSGLGRDYTERYWQETVLHTGATRLIAIHFEDFMAPFGETRLLPRFLDDVVTTAGWIDELVAADERELKIELPVFGQPIALY